MDPRVKTSSRDLATQFRLSRQVYDRWREFSAVQEQGRSIRTQLTLLKTKAQSQALKDHIEMLSQKVTSVLGADNAPPGAPTTTTTPTVQSTLVRLRTLFTVMQGVDLAPTPQVSASVADVSREAAGVAASWQSIKTTDIPALNRDLSAAGLDVLRVE
jgi:P2-related tail formation protein